VAKEFFAAQGIEFDARDVTSNPEYLRELLDATNGMRGVPVIIIDGQVTRGFHREKVIEQLGLHA